jgi:hypothetical protein
MGSGDHLFVSRTELAKQDIAFDRLIGKAEDLSADCEALAVRDQKLCGVMHVLSAERVDSSC